MKRALLALCTVLLAAGCSCSILGCESPKDEETCPYVQAFQWVTHLFR